ncbi:hypothetical protein HHI36_005338, partial [Cryptolaemus montrouzieri]
SDDEPCERNPGAADGNISCNQRKEVCGDEVRASSATADVPEDELKYDLVLSKSKKRPTQEPEVNFAAANPLPRGPRPTGSRTCPKMGLQPSTSTSITVKKPKIPFPFTLRNKAVQCR